eukprot:TRINITY_DN2979_c0_g2_i5.p1 TRINITY_DN2979_c0_g2~~TRINITY_DN2979_c0_g2_i5.p1  ORF type:complete len:458 (+),score=116.29 TRINITY_DN2979_c0_g2_i5:107-1480(+)
MGTPTSKVESMNSFSAFFGNFEAHSMLRPEKVPVVLSAKTAGLIDSFVADTLDRSRVGIISSSHPHAEPNSFDRLPVSKIKMQKNGFLDTISLKNSVIYLGRSPRHKKPHKRKKSALSKDVDPGYTVEMEERKLFISSIFMSLPFKSSLDKVSAYAVKSQMGKIITKPNKPNQDAYFIIKNPIDIENGYLFGVMDGHGLFGKEVSSLVKTRLPANLFSSSSHNVTEVRQSFLLNPDFRASLIKSGYEKTNEELSRSPFDISYSGTTSVTVFTHESLLLCANVGDSRAIIASTHNEDPLQWHVQQITTDHKPELLHEYQRILMHNGRVEALRGKSWCEVDASGRAMGPRRVWMKSKNCPGLAMSRALGDAVASKLGVISVPDIFEIRVNEGHKVLVIASDGIWGVLSNEEVMRVAGSFYRAKDAEKACKALVQRATAVWNKLGENIDDITVIVVFLNN